MRSSGGVVGIEVDRGRKVGALGHARADPHAERRRGLQRVDHVEVVRPGFGQVLPRMRAGVGGDETLLPIRRRPVGVMALQRRAVVLALVAEQLPERLDVGRIAHQAVPVVVRDLVAEMAEQRAVGLAHLPPHALALGIVGLGEVDGDEAVVVAGHHRLGRRAVRRQLRQEVERQPVLRILQLGLQRQPELEQRVEQPVLGELDPAASSPGSRRATDRGSSGCDGRPRRTARGCRPRPASCRRRTGSWRSSGSGPCAQPAPAGRACPLPGR